MTPSSAARYKHNSLMEAEGTDPIYIVAVLKQVINNKECVDFLEAAAFLQPILRKYKIVHIKYVKKTHTTVLITLTVRQYFQ